MTIISIEHGINTEGFQVIVKDDEGYIRDAVRYDFGYNVARKPGDTYKGFGKEELPTVQEILSNYDKPFEVIAGRNVFADKPVANRYVEEFIDEYIGKENVL